MYDQKQIEIIKKWLGSGSINIFGRPFSGKDSQGQKLAEILDGNLLGGGEILRNSIMPDRILEYAKTGKLIPSEDYISIVLPYLSQSKLANKPLILSSVGRWHGEEDGVLLALEAAQHPLKAVIYLDITNNEALARWQARDVNQDREGRQDDSEGLLDTRFEEFDKKTLPVIDYYREKSLMIEIDGKDNREEVTHRMLNALINFINNEA